MSVPSGPDVEWVRGLAEGDRVGVAEFGRLLFVGVVLRKTPRTQILKVAPDRTYRLHAAEAFYSTHRWEHLIGRAPYGSRYLVKPEDKP